MAIKAKTITRSETTTGLLQQYYCRICMKTYARPDYFYEAPFSEIDKNGKMSICKSCCDEAFLRFYNGYGELEKSLYLTCKYLDVAFYYTTVKSVETIIENKNLDPKRDKIFGRYAQEYKAFTRTTQQESGSNKTRDDRFCNSDMYRGDLDGDEILNRDDEELEKLRNLISFWGNGKDEWEYRFLENELFQIQTSFECPDYGMAMIQKDIAFYNLEIEKSRREGRDPSRLIESRAKLMNDAKMKPIQSSGIESNDTITFGTLIKKFENEKPVPRPVDHEMKKYFDYMIGQLGIMEGFNNDSTDKFKEDMKEYTIDFEEEYKKNADATDNLIEEESIIEENEDS